MWVILLASVCSFFGFVLFFPLSSSFSLISNAHPGFHVTNGKLMDLPGYLLDELLKQILSGIKINTIFKKQLLLYPSNMHKYTILKFTIFAFHNERISEVFITVK